MNDRIEMVNVKFLMDTVHPDYGDIKEGEILRVERPYMIHYEKLGIAEYTEKPVTRKGW